MVEAQGDDGEEEVDDMDAKKGLALAMERERQRRFIAVLDRAFFCHCHSILRVSKDPI